MRAWYVVDGTKKYKCEFVSVNTLKCKLWLKLKNITFHIDYNTERDYQYAKRGELTRGMATKGKNIKPIKFIFE